MASKKRGQNFGNGGEGNGNLRKKQRSKSPTRKVVGQEDSLSSKDNPALESNSQINKDQSDIQSNNDQSNNDLGNSEDRKDQNNDQEKNDGGEKMGVRWFMAIIIFAHFFFKVVAFGNLRAQSAQYVMLLNLIIFSYRFQLGKSKDDASEHAGRVHTVLIANCTYILCFAFVLILRRFVVCLHNPSEEVSCLRDLWNAVLGEVADIVNLVLILYPMSFMILRLVFAILNSWKSEKIGYMFLILCFNGMVSAYDLKIRKEPILTKGSMLLFFTFFFYLEHSVLEYYNQSQQSSCMHSIAGCVQSIAGLIGRFISQTWAACTTHIKQWNWIPNSAFRAGEILFDLYVLHPLSLLLGAEKARVFLGLPKTDSAPIRGINYWECIEFSLVHVVGVTHSSEATLPLFAILVLWPLLNLRFKLSTATILVLFGIISLFLRENFKLNFVLALVLYACAKQCFGYIFGLFGSTQDETEKPEKTEAELKVRSIGFAVHIFPIVHFFATWIILVLLYFVVTVNSAAAIMVSGDNDDWFLWCMKRLSLFALFITFLPFVKLGLEGVLDTNDDFKNLSASMRDFFAKKSHAPGNDPPKPFPYFQCILFLLTFVSSRFFSETSGLWTSTLRGNYSEDKSGLSMTMFDLTLRRNDTTHEHVRVQRSANHSYSSCSMRWGGNLTPLDHAILAKMSYFQATNEDLPEELTGMQEALKFAFPEPQYKVTLDVDWKGDGVHPMRKGAQDGKDVFTKYYKIDFHNLKHTVIAVQGTDFSDYADALADLRLIVPSALVDFAEWFIPTLNLLLPRHRTAMQRFIDQMQAWFTLDAEELDAYKPIVRYVHELLNNKTRRDYVTDSEGCSGDECWTMSVTGHSLGGCLALIVGTTLEIPSVTFSGPGLMFAKGQYETDVNGEILSPKLASAARISTAFIPSSDIVPRVDTHFGHTQDMVCPRRNGIFTCHYLSDNICDLLLRCGDNQDQTRFHSCKASIPPVFDKKELEECISGGEG